MGNCFDYNTIFIEVRMVGEGYRFMSTNALFISVYEISQNPPRQRLRFLNYSDT